MRAIDQKNKRTYNCAMTPNQVVDFFGSQSKAARALGIEQPSIHGWVSSGSIPEVRQYQIELATSGALVADRPALRTNERKALRDAIKEAVDKVRHSPAKGSEGRAGKRSK